MKSKDETWRNNGQHSKPLRPNGRWQCIATESFTAARWAFWGTGLGEYKKVRAELIQSEFSYHFESPLNVDALTPGDCWISQAISSTAPPWDIHALAPQVPEGLCNHQDGIVRQRRGVLHRETMTWLLHNLPQCPLVPILSLWDNLDYIFPFVLFNGN